MFWLDQTIKDLLAVNPRDHYVVTDWKTPSGQIHVGGLRGVITHGAIASGLTEQGKKVSWQYGFDDADPLDSLPPDLPRSYQKFLGQPLSTIQAPVSGYGSLADYYAQEFIDVFTQLGEKPKIVWSYKLYKNGVFNKAIQISLEKAAIIRGVYWQVTKKRQPDDWLPIQMVCGRCGKISTTRAFKWDGQQVWYKCQSDWVKYAKGCGYEGRGSPFDGQAKLPWRVEWPAKWYIFKSDVEGAGKDHQTKGGSHDMAVAILTQVFNQKPPYNIPYEFFLVGGRKMSSSKGIGVAAHQVSQAVPPELLRLLMVMSRPNRAINFSLEGEALPRLYDEYDKAAKAFQDDPTSDGGRLFSYAVLPSTPTKSFLCRFSKVAYLTQMPHLNILAKVAEEKGQALTKPEKQLLNSRIVIAKKWLENWAPAEYKITVQKTLPKVTEQLTDQQKQFLDRLAQAIDSRKDWQGQVLHTKIHQLKQMLGLQSSAAFQAIYLAILGGQSGPPAGWFLAALDKKFTVDRLKLIK